MKTLLRFLMMGVLVWFGYKIFDARSRLAQSQLDHVPAQVSQRKLASDPRPRSAPAPAPASQFKCDGRIHCSQMKSCAEATWFLNQCPGTRMDGDHDGIPCEQQWC
ncbi:MAG: excalibur calcium-binding domain-containing protein [Ahniella sp.]|nr:excalibur calcium-binding domain-containing protein [Ahniella sp.]